MKIKGKVELEDGGYTDVIIHQFGEVYGYQCAFLTRITPFDGKVFCVKLEFVRIDRQEIKEVA